MLAIRRDNRRYLARATHEDCHRNQSCNRVDGAAGLDRSGADDFSDRISDRADGALRYRARAIDLVTDADVVGDLQQSDPAASGEDLLWTISVAAIVRRQSELALGRAPAVPNKRTRGASDRGTIVLASGSKI